MANRVARAHQIAASWQMACCRAGIGVSEWTVDHLRAGHALRTDEALGRVVETDPAKTLESPPRTRDG